MQGKNEGEGSIEGSTYRRSEEDRRNDDQRGGDGMKRRKERTKARKWCRCRGQRFGEVEMTMEE